MIHTTQKGYTLIEVIVVIFIFFVMTSIVTFNYVQFKSDTILTNMAYEVALTIREAQIYGVSVRNSEPNSFSKSYGIYLPIDSQKYFVFLDGGSSPDKKFTGTSCENNQTDVCATTYSLQRKMIISTINKIEDDGNCGASETTGLSIIFERPNPEPVINGTIQDTENMGHVEIAIKEPGSNTQRFIEVYKNGQIAVKTEGVCP